MEHVQGSGIQQLDVSSLASGEKHVVNLRSIQHNGTKGWFRRFLPLDFLQVINTSSEPLQVYLNDHGFIVPGNSTKSVSGQQFTYIEIENAGSSSIAPDEIELEVEKTPYDADDQARRESNLTPIEQLLDIF